MSEDYPRPQLVRDAWTSLDGPWDFAIDKDGRWRAPADVQWDGTIEVPFAVETPASGIGDTGFHPVCWYHRTVTLPEIEPGDRVVVHFGAVDYEAKVWIDGELVGHNEGGYTSFTVDVPPGALAWPTFQLVVRVDDDPHDLAKPRGKQDWQVEPHGIWYHRTTGIWQTVWMERVPPVSIDRLRWTPNLDDVEIAMSLELAGALDTPVRVRVRLALGELLLVDDVVAVTGCRIERRFSIDHPELDPMRDGVTWSPEHPVLIDAEVDLVAVDGTVIDSVRSYTALRSVAVQAGRFTLNGRPYEMRLVLDQGYWPDTGMTAPDAAAFRRDLELAKAMGFNGVRKHQKIEDPRFLAAADRLGMLVWAEMPSAYRFEPRAVRRCLSQWGAAIERDCSHPCIVAWVLFNESYGIIDVGHRQDQRHWVEAATSMARALDTTRLVVGNDGWQNLAGDLITIHDYDPIPELIADRYDADSLDGVLRGFGRHGRVICLDDPAEPADRVGPTPSRRAVLLTEFGGIAWSAEQDAEPVLEHQDDTSANQAFPASGDAWGYSAAKDENDLLRRYAAVVGAVQSLRELSGFCYTQLTDVYQEVNGLLTADRRPKAPLDAIAAVTRGDRADASGSG